MNMHVSEFKPLYDLGLDQDRIIKVASEIEYRNVNYETEDFLVYKIRHGQPKFGQIYFFFESFESWFAVCKKWKIVVKEFNCYRIEEANKFTVFNIVDIIDHHALNCFKVSGKFYIKLPFALY